MKYNLLFLFVFVTYIIQAQNIGLHITDPEEDIHMKGNIRLDGTDNATFMQIFKAKRSLQLGLFDPVRLDIDSIGQYAVVFGQNNTSTGNGSLSQGYFSRAVGNYSIALGGNINSLTDFSFGQGQGHKIYGTRSVAFGVYNIVYGTDCFVTGWNNRSFESYSSIFGKDNDAYGVNNFVAGRNLDGNSYLASYFGQYNSTYDTNNGEVWEPEEPIFVVANGESQAQANNAFVILKNGNIGVDVKYPTEKLDVDGNISTTGYFKGDGSLLTNLPLNTYWEESGTLLYNLNNKFTIGENYGDHKFSVFGEDPMLIRTNDPDETQKGLEIQMLENSTTPAGIMGRAGQTINVISSNQNTGSFIHVEGSDNIYPQRGMDIEVSGGVFSVGIDVEATGENGINYGIYSRATGLAGSLAAKFVGDVECTNDLIVQNDVIVNDDAFIQDDLTVSGKTTISKLKVGPGASSNFRAMQGGTFTAGADNTPNDQDPATGVKVMSVTFPYAFPSTPKIIITASGQPGTSWNDAFNVTTRSVTTSGCVLIITRLDSNAYWSQNLKIDWFGFSF